MPLSTARVRLIALIGAVCALVVACGEREREVDIAARNGVLLVSNGSEPKALDPHIVTGVPENKIIQALIEGLIAYHPTDDLAPEPGMAESWTHNDRFTEWTFALRKDAAWTNGDPVVAEDFVYSWRRILSPELGSEYAEMLYVIAGAEAFHRGELEDFSAVGVKAIDAHTLKVTLEGETPHFLSLLKHYSFYPVNPRAVEAHGGMLDRQSGWSTLENYVGNGAFRLTEWVTNQVITVEKNPDYWDADRVSLSAIRFFPIENKRTEETMYRGGRLHLTASVPANKIPLLREQLPDQLQTDPYLGTYYYQLNVTRPPFDDPRVRKALALAIDREALVNRVTQGGQAPATGYVPQGIGDYPAMEALSFDPAQAKALLAEAGFPDGAGFPRKEVLINTSEDHRRIAEAIQAMWQEHLGITVGIYNQEWKVYLNSRSKLDYDVARAGWIADYVYPTTFLNMFTTGNGNNNTGWSSEEYDQLIRDARVAPSSEERLRILREAETILMAELPVIPIYWYTTTYLKDPRIKGYAPKVLDNRPYKYLSLSAE